MELVVKTRFEIGDEVYVLSSGNIHKIIIHGINIEYENEKVAVRYEADEDITKTYEYYFDEADIFEDPHELCRKLLNNIVK